MLDYQDILSKLNKSPFRAKFRLSKQDLQYIDKKGLSTIRSHAYDFVKKRLAPYPTLNDGKQTPMRKHPVFVAQHATATCCRSCLEKWHKIPKYKALDSYEIDFIVNLIMAWIDSQIEKSKNPSNRI